MASQLLATKSIVELHEQESSGNQLRRALTATQLTLLGIGGIIGTGIFVLTGTAAAEHAGPALALSFIVARPAHEPGFRLDREESGDRRIRYTLRAYAADAPHGERYGART